MAGAPPNPETFRHHFLARGVGYYVAGRFAVRAGLNPTPGNLLHHAVEMFLKAALVGTRSVRDLRKLSHDIREIWKEFKASDGTLDRFDDAIGRLHAFEELRYPDEIARAGGATVIGWKRAPGAITFDPGTQMTLYELALDEIDDLIIAICDRSGVDLYSLTPFNEHARHALYERSAHAARWRPPPGHPAA